MKEIKLGPGEHTVVDQLQVSSETKITGVTEEQVLQAAADYRDYALPVKAFRAGKCDYCGSGAKKPKKLANGSVVDIRVPVAKLPNKLMVCYGCYAKTQEKVKKDERNRSKV
jgi:hypothetical protein